MESPHSIRARALRAIPRGVRIRHWVVAIALIWAAAPAWAGQIYAFVDGQGVTHFTNRPRGDRRFKPIKLRDNLSAPSKYREPRSRQYDPLIGDAAANHGVPPALVKAVIAAESQFRSDAVSQKGAQGLMQLMPDTAEEMGVDNPFEPGQNVRGGTSYLRALIDRYGDLGRALAAYNAGPTMVDRYNGIPPFQETRDYVDRVLTYYRRYHGDFAR